MNDWGGARSLLCVRLDALGDVLMTTPALRALKHSVPNRRLTLLTSPAGAEIAALVPEVDRCLVYDAPWLKATAPRRDARPDLDMVRALAAEGFDGAVVFTVYSQSPLPAALLCYLAGIARRAAHCRENPYQLLTDWVAEPEPERIVRHEARRQLDLVAALGATTRDESISLRVPRSARERVSALLDAAGVDPGGAWVAVAPGASAPSRRWPPEHYAALTRMLVASGWDVVFTGSPAERAMVEGIRAAAGVATHSLAGALDLGELAALLERATLLVANNSGPVHIAAAVGTPVVDLYALTNPQHTPWGVAHRVLSHDVPCRWCYKSVCPEGHHNCLRLVTPRAAFDAVGEVIAATGPHLGAQPTRQ